MQELICSCEDFIGSEKQKNKNLANPSAVLNTISALISIIHQQQQHQKKNQLTPATNQQTTVTNKIEHSDVKFNKIDNDKDDVCTRNDCTNAVFYDRSNENNDEKFSNEIIHVYSNESQSSALKKFTKCEIEVDANKLNNFEPKIFNKIYYDNTENNSFNYNYNTEKMNNESSVNITDCIKCEEILNVNNFNLTKNKIVNAYAVNNNDDKVINKISNSRVACTSDKIVTKRIEFLYSDRSNSGSYIFKKDSSIKLPLKSIKEDFFSNINQDSIFFTVFLLCIFLITLLLIIFSI